MNTQEFYPSNKLWVGNVNTNVSKQDLETLFGRFGMVSRVHLDTFRRFAFIEFSAIEFAMSAIQHLQGHVLDGNRLIIQFPKLDARYDGQHHVGSNSNFPHHPKRHHPNPSDLVVPYPAPGAGQHLPPHDVAGTSNSSVPPQGFNLPNICGTVTGPWRQPSYTALPNKAEPVAQVVQHMAQYAPSSSEVEPDYVWRGIIAKGGVPICDALCVPIGQWIDPDMPQVLNCFDRTTLDALQRYDWSTIGFSMVLFLPDAEDSFTPYTELLAYFTHKERVGVAKLNNDKRLFLVPGPSHFLRDCLKFSGSETRLYGVVVKSLPTNVSTALRVKPPSRDPRLRDPRQRAGNILHSRHVQTASTASRPGSGPKVEGEEITHGQDHHHQQQDDSTGQQMMMGVPLVAASSSNDHNLNAKAPQGALQYPPRIQLKRRRYQLAEDS